MTTLIERLSAPFHLWQHEYRKQTRGRDEVTGYLTYIGIEHAIGRMNDVLGTNWGWTIIETQFVPVGEKPAVVTRGRIWWRDDEGREYWREGQGAAQYTSSADDLDKVVKSAQAEAFKKASHQIGMGAYLWDKGLADQIALELLAEEGRQWEAKGRPKRPRPGNPAAVILDQVKTAPSASRPTGPPEDPHEAIWEAAKAAAPQAGEKSLSEAVAQALQEWSDGQAGDPAALDAENAANFAAAIRKDGTMIRRHLPKHAQQAEPKQVVECRSCSAPVVWLTTRNGKRMPTDAASVADGDTEFDRRRHRSHFDTCANAASHRAAVAR
jgi:hypothetical protein